MMQKFCTENHFVRVLPSLSLQSHLWDGVSYLLLCNRLPQKLNIKTINTMIFKRCQVRQESGVWFGWVVLDQPSERCNQNIAKAGGFPDGPVVKTQHSHCSRPVWFLVRECKIWHAIIKDPMCRKEDQKSWKVATKMGHGQIKNKDIKNSNAARLRSLRGLTGVGVVPWLDYTELLHAGYWPEARVSQYADISIGLLGCPHNMAAGFLQSKGRERKKPRGRERKETTFCSSGATY